MKAPRRLPDKRRAPDRVPASILNAYRATTFWVEAQSGRIALRDGERSPGLDDLLAQDGAESWAFITAWNPRSQPLARGVNARRQRQLERYVIRQGHAILPGLGVPDDGDWTPERSCLVLGVTRAAALRLGAAAGQYAIVAGRKGERARILSCTRASICPDPRARELVDSGPQSRRSEGRRPSRRAPARGGR
jgi:hypothetical protein